MTTIYAYGIGIASKNQAGEIIEVFYPQPVLAPCQEELEEINAIGLSDGTSVLNEFQLTSLAASDYLPIATLIESLKDARKTIVLSIAQQDSAPADVGTAFLKLHLLSHRLVKPHETVLDGVFGILHNLAWTSEGPIELNELPARQLQARLEGRALSVNCIDKFPKMTDYVVPSGVRIADAARIRLGAYIGEGTTVMHEGFVNFNAGTAGPAMIEGRISAGVWVGSHSDLGGGSSTMGTLSGGGNIVISVGEHCLIGANAGTGIPLGDHCTIESGLYITAGTKIQLVNDEGTQGDIIKAKELAGQNHLLFRRNSQSGAVECHTNLSSIELNDMLHSN